MSYPVGRFCELELEAADGRRVTLEKVALTEENRRAVRDAAYAPGGRGNPLPDPGALPRVERAHATAIDPRYESLATLVEAIPTRPLTPDAITADLDQLEWHVQNEFSYRDLRGVDVAAAFDTARTALLEAKTVDLGTFALTLTKLVSTFGDGHARVQGALGLVPGPYLPFLLFDTADGVVAIRPDRTGFADEPRPRVMALDGIDIERWIEASARFLPDGSAHFRRRHGLRGLRYVQAARAELGLEAKGTIEVEFARLDGKGARTETLPLAARRPIYGDPPLGTHRRIGDDEQFGYLRIPRMDDAPEVLQALTAAMNGFRGTEGLVIDVRENGGGSRAILRHLYPYFLRPDEDAVVGNVARFRLREGDAADDPNGHLANRFLYPAAWSDWSDAARDAIADLEQEFRPRWTPPVDDEFSVPHYMVLERSANPDAFRYEGPVVVLIDAGCFSATDIFVGAFAERPQVTLIGSDTGGGSGRSRRVRLAHSGLELRLSSMVSWRPTGALYDGFGIEADRTLPASASDALHATDSVLDAALQHLADQ